MKKLVVHCKTKKENDELLKTLDKSKYRRIAGWEKPSSMDIYNVYNNETCYILDKDLNFCSRDFAINQWFNIISLKEFMTWKLDTKVRHKETNFSENVLSYYYCPECWCKIKENQKICHKCNTELVRNQKETTSNKWNNNNEYNKNKDTEKNTYKCQYCKWEIDSDALKCKFCWERVKKKKEKKERLWLWIIMIILYIILLSWYNKAKLTSTFWWDIIDILNWRLYEFLWIPLIMTISYVIGMWFCKNKRVKIIFSIIFFWSILISWLVYKWQEIQQENINNVKMWNNFMETNPEVFNK